MTLIKDGKTDHRIGIGITAIGTSQWGRDWAHPQRQHELVRIYSQGGGCRQWVENYEEKTSGKRKTLAKQTKHDCC